MRKKFVAIIIVVCMVISIVPSSFYATESLEPIQDDKMQYASSKYEILYDDDDMVSYLKEKYSEYSSVSVSSVSSESPLNTYNYSQTSLNSYYNANNNEYYDNGINGTCTQVAISIMTEYMKRKKEITPYVTCNTIHDIFANVITASHACLWDGNGTPRNMTVNIVDSNFYYYSPYYYGDYSWLFMESKIQDSLADGIPVVVHLDGHTVTGVGFVKKKVTYKKKNIWGVMTTYTQEETFLIINNGWYNTSTNSSKTYSYVHFDDVLSIVVSKG